LKKLKEDNQLKGKGADGRILLKWMLEIGWDCEDWDRISDEIF
jgi:hypothetical protein